ncbi:unnamed protein product [Rangifer tarandus platyrhynchus]|uniref:Uncharacterized protein n=2 Tax=Rangifer tarandus platyrhynchus TaxID=3082113 RepID=A0ACB0E3Q4_RANTA|nr:unnamed protein product [Rangifer tarandus platyrhynchus]CAI9695252.1 unnamed protein product [Rangifer tarandus platyrhynchus]
MRGWLERKSLCGSGGGGGAGSTRRSPLWPKAEKTVELLEQKTEKGGGVGMRKACKENFRGGPALLLTLGQRPSRGSRGRERLSGHTFLEVGAGHLIQAVRRGVSGYRCGIPGSRDALAHGRGHRAERTDRFTALGVCGAAPPPTPGSGGPPLCGFEVHRGTEEAQPEPPLLLNPGRRRDARLRTHFSCSGLWPLLAWHQASLAYLLKRLQALKGQAARATELLQGTGLGQRSQPHLGNMLTYPGTLLGVLILTAPTSVPNTSHPGLSPEQALGACLEARPRPSFLKCLNTYVRLQWGFCMSIGRCGGKRFGCRKSVHELAAPGRIQLALVLGALVPEVTPSLGTAKAMGLSERRRLSGPLCTGGPGAERAGLLSLPVRPASVEENSTADIHVCTTLLHSEAVTHQTLQNNICERRWIWLAVP